MAKNEQYDADKMETSSFPFFDPGEFMKFGTRNLEVATRAARAYYNGMSKLNREMTSFVNARVKKDIDAARSLMTSRTSESAFHTQAEFVEDAIRDYADESSRVLHLAADMAHATLAPVEERAEEMLNKFDARAELAEKKKAAAE
ncbi:MAG: phasin family protein [Pseudomonadota bacterium]